MMKALKVAFHQGEYAMSQQHELQEAILYSPDLAEKGVVLTLDHTARTLGVAALIQNVGLGNASGPFEIDMAVTLDRGGFTTSYVNNFEVPVSVTLYAKPIFELALARSAVVVPTPFETEYLTDRMEVPLYYRDEDPSAIYTIDYLVDAEYQVPDTDRPNNIFHAIWWTTTPGASRRGKPFVVESR
jgi:hypothetical protein